MCILLSQIYDFLKNVTEGDNFWQNATRKTHPAFLRVPPSQGWVWSCWWTSSSWWFFISLFDILILVINSFISINLIISISADLIYSWSVPTMAALLANLSSIYHQFTINCHQFTINLSSIHRQLIINLSSIYHTSIITLSVAEVSLQWLLCWPIPAEACLSLCLSLPAFYNLFRKWKWIFL